MKTKSLALLLIVVSVGCLRHRGWLQHQDSSVRIPSYDSIMAGGPIDGPTLRALQVAVSDFFPGWGPPRACIDTPEAHRYYALRRGELIYVAILQDPGYCGREHSSLDAGARYAISVDGRILRRLLDGEPELDTPAEDGFEEGGSEPASLDGGTTAIDVTVPPEARVSFPVFAEPGSSSADGGNPSADGGGLSPDGGTP